MNTLREMKTLRDHYLARLRSLDNSNRRGAPDSP
jgi:hypothetical protein